MAGHQARCPQDPDPERAADDDGKAEADAENAAEAARRRSGAGGRFEHDFRLRGHGLRATSTTSTALPMLRAEWLDPRASNSTSPGIHRFTFVWPFAVSSISPPDKWTTSVSERVRVKPLARANFHARAQDRDLVILKERVEAHAGEWRVPRLGSLHRVGRQTRHPSRLDDDRQPTIATGLRWACHVIHPHGRSHSATRSIRDRHDDAGTLFDADQRSSGSIRPDAHVVEHDRRSIAAATHCSASALA